MKFLMLLLYMLNDQPVLEKQIFDTLDECMMVGATKAQKLDTVLFGSCVSVKAQKVDLK